MDNLKKSIEILKLMGWHPVKMTKYHNEGWYRLADENGNWLLEDPAHAEPDSVWRSAPNLYEPGNTHLTWLVLNWVAQKSPFKTEFSLYWRNSDSWMRPIEAAQGEWLDKVLDLAITTTPDDGQCSGNGQDKGIGA